MKNTHDNRSIYATVASMVCIAGIVSLTLPAQASITTKYDNIIAPIVGQGNTSGGWTSATTDGGLTLSLRAQDRYTGTGDQTPNDGAGTFTFPAGQQWDVWFDVNSGSSSLSTYDYSLSVSSSLDGVQHNLSISSTFPSDNGVVGNEFQNAEWLGFAFIGGYDMSQQATYNFKLRATDDNGSVDSVNMTVVNNGVAAVPEPSTVVAGALLLVPFGLSTLRMVRKGRMV